MLAAPRRPPYAGYVAAPFADVRVPAVRRDCDEALWALLRATSSRRDGASGPDNNALLGSMAAIINCTGHIQPEGVVAITDVARSCYMDLIESAAGGRSAGVVAPRLLDEIHTAAVTCLRPRDRLRYLSTLPW